jgi:dTDP-4-dehydrorhamnose reductase
MRILVTGASGMLGATIVKMLSDQFTVYATGNSNFENSFSRYKKFDLYTENYNELIKWSTPDIIILCGALTNGNYCNNNPEIAFNINGVSVKKFIDATRENVKIIYISTDAVFPSALHFAKETDCVSPENVYGKSKELGEFFLINSNRKFAIIRTTIVGLNINKSKSGFVEWIINSSKNNESISLFEDVVFTPITIWDLSKELCFLIKNNNIFSEILHISGKSICTKYEFGKSILEALNIDSSKVEKGSIKSFEDRAKRCTDQTLDCTNYQNKYNRNLPSLLETISTIKKYYGEQY